MTERKRSRIFKWRDMFENLMNSLHDFTTKMNFRQLSMDRDKPFQYTEIKKVMNAIYKKEDICLIGYLESRTFNLNQQEIESLSGK